MKKLQKPIYGYQFNESIGITDQIKPMETVNIGSMKMTALHNPSHTLDHISYLLKVEGVDQKFLFSGKKMNIL